jgi:hypothetical protein
MLKGSEEFQSVRFFQEDNPSLSNHLLLASNAATDGSTDDTNSSQSEGLVSYGISWISFVVSATFIALISNGIFGIPLYQVVDVQLSLFLTWAGLLAIVWALFAVYDLYHWDLSEVLSDLLHVLAFALLPFGAMTGYALYGWIGGMQVHGASFVFDGYFGIYKDTFIIIATQISNLMGALSASEVTKGGTLTIDTDALLKWTQIVAGSLAALDVLRRWTAPAQAQPNRQRR